MVAWEGKKQAVIDKLAVFIDGLQPRDRERIYRHFEQVELLTGEIGQRALEAAFRTRPGFSARLADFDSDRARGIMALLENSSAFEEALAYRDADELRTGRSYQGYRVPKAPPGVATDPERWRAFEAELQSVLGPSGGTDRRLQTERFDRPRLHEDGNVAGSLLQISIYVEGNPETQSVFGPDGPEPLVVTPTLTAAVLYDAGEKQFEVAGRGGKRRLDQIAAAFASNLLASEENPEGVIPLQYKLDCLKRPQDFVSEPADGIKEVRLVMLKLHGDDGGHARVALELGSKANIDLWTAAEAWFADNNPLTGTAWEVQQARIRVVFHKAPGERKDRVINIDLRGPHRCNLKDQVQRERLLAEKYLRRWGLVGEISDGSSRAA